MNETYGMTSQMRRSSTSIAERIGLMPETEATRLLGHTEEIGKMLRSMVRSLQQKP